MTKRSEPTETMYDLTCTRLRRALVGPARHQSPVAGPAMTGKDELALRCSGTVPARAKAPSSSRRTTTPTTSQRTSANRCRIWRTPSSASSTAEGTLETTARRPRARLRSPRLLARRPHRHRYRHHEGPRRAPQQRPRPGPTRAVLALDDADLHGQEDRLQALSHPLSRLDAAGYVGVFTIDSGAHDDQTLQVIKQAFDGLVEVREDDGTRQARVLGLSSNPSDWQDL